MTINPAFERIQRDLEDAVSKESELRNHVFSQLGFLSAQNATEIFEPLLLSFQYVVGAAGASLTLFDKSKNVLAFQQATGMSSDSIVGMEVPLEGSLIGMVFVSGEATASRPVAGEIQRQTGESHDSLLAAPLILGDESVGTISAVNKESGGGFTDEDVEAATQFAVVAAQLLRFQSGLNSLQKAINASASDELAILDSDQKLFKLHQGIARLVARDDSWLEDLSLFVRQAEKRM